MNRTVLIVDDSPEERDIFARYLQFVGGTIVQASHGQEGIERARELLPDLILLDLSMPVLDGWQTIERLRSDPATSHIPVLALTCHHLEWSRLKEAGFSGYLEKPIVPFRVLEEVEHCIGRLHLERRNVRNDHRSRPGNHPRWAAPVRRSPLASLG
jgi:two-component system cell cycle response regulator DivK